MNTSIPDPNSTSSPEPFCGETITITIDVPAQERAKMIRHLNWLFDGERGPDPRYESVYYTITRQISA